MNRFKFKVLCNNNETPLLLKEEFKIYNNKVFREIFSIWINTNEITWIMDKIYKYRDSVIRVYIDKAEIDLN